MKNINGQELKPNLEIMAEWETIEKEVFELIEKTENEAPSAETVRFMITLPKEWAILAAWLEAIGNSRKEDKLYPLRRPVSLDTFTDQKGFRSHVWQTLNNYYHEELHWLATRSHPYLYEEDPELGKGYIADNDAPF